MRNKSGFYSFAFTLLGIICGFSLAILLLPANANVRAANAAQAISNPSSSSAVGDYQIGDTPEEATVAVPSSRSFSYQGVLRKDGQPVNGGCNFKLSLWDAQTAGSQLGSTQTFTTTVSSGQYSLVMNQSSSTINTTFDGRALWLAVSVRCPQGTGTYSDITPRQALEAAPLASGLVAHTEIRSGNSYSGNPVLKLTALGTSYGNPSGLWAITDEPPGIGATWNKVGVWADSYNGMGVRGTTATGIAIEGDAKNSVGHAGVFSGTVDINGNLFVLGKNLSFLNASQVLDTHAGLPLTSPSFTTHGGTLLVFVSGSGFSNSLGWIGANVAIDSNPLGSILVHNNLSGVHMAFIPKQFVVTGLAAGTHTITLTQYNVNTITDNNDFFSVTVTELP